MIIRMSPAVWMSIPATVASTAYLRIAPTAIRKSDVPIAMGHTFPSRRACKLLLLGGWTDDSVVAEPADVRRRGRFELLLEDAAGYLRHRSLHALQFRERALESLERYWQLDERSEAEPVWFERSFAFKIGPHLLRGRVDRVDRHPDGSFELIDYKTGKAKTADELREDVQLSVYQMGARESWQLETSAQSYFYVLTGEKVPVTHSAEELERVSGTVATIADGILAQEFEPTPSPEICSFRDYKIICPAAEK